MRTTLTLEADVAIRLKREMARGGMSFKETVNTFLRLGLQAADRSHIGKPFEVRPYSLGAPAAGLDLDNLGELLEHIEGPAHR